MAKKCNFSNTAVQCCVICFGNC